MHLPNYTGRKQPALGCLVAALRSKKGIDCQSRPLQADWLSRRLPAQQGRLLLSLSQGNVTFRTVIMCDKMAMGANCSSLEQRESLLFHIQVGPWFAKSCRKQLCPTCYGQLCRQMDLALHTREWNYASVLTFLGQPCRVLQEILHPLDFQQECCLQQCRWKPLRHVEDSWKASYVAMNFAAWAALSACTDPPGSQLQIKGLSFQACENGH